MGSLILATLGMMGFTFVIGFVVAGVIKLTAFGADHMDYYNLNRNELKRLHKVRKARYKRLKNLMKEIENNDPKYREEFYHGVSRGFLKFDLCDYYYPEEKEIQTVENEMDYKISKDFDFNSMNKKKG